MQQGILFLIDLTQCMYVCMFPHLIMGLAPSINVMHAANVCESLQWTVTALLFLCISVRAFSSHAAVPCTAALDKIGCLALQVQQCACTSVI